ncbi:MAG TPA: hypothetical protein VND93_30295 [Myxococcales bacterium]|nr:hypothetical protein [Myxococcales bacterium]
MAELTRPTPANRADYVSGTLLTLAAVLCAGALFREGDGTGPRAFGWIAGVVALDFFAAMIGFWLEPLRRRHGFVRALAVAGALVLAAGGLAYSRMLPGFTLLSYWIPAALAMLAAVRLTRAHREQEGRPVHVRVRRRPEPRP